MLKVTAKHYTPLFLLVLLFANTLSAGMFKAGRVMPANRSSRFGITAGTVSDINGAVEETTRKLYDVTGDYWKQDTAESYDLNDFGMDDSYPAFGLEYEANGQFFSFMCDASIFKISAQATAQRNYYIGVGKSVGYNGASYKNIQIPEGSEFSMDIIGTLANFRALLTPFTVKPSDNFSFSPWGIASIMIFAGQYDLDAGQPSGTTVYMNPPETFVIGGQSSGILGLGLPEIGFGGEMRIGKPEGMELVAQINYAMCKFSGSTGFLTSSKHREKNAEIDHENLMGRLMLQFPLSEGRAFFVGGQFQQIDSEATITSTSEDPEEIIANRERFDKEASFHLKSTMLILGWTF